MKANNKSTLQKDIFLTGEYVQHFKPDSSKNPFAKIYDKKKQGVIDIINRSPTPKRILDVGGGMGRISLVLAQSKNNHVVLTDISRDMLKLAQKNADNNNRLHIVNADAHFLPFPDYSFDIIVGLDLFCHLANPKVVLKTFHQLLKDQGVLILDSTNSNPFWAIFYPRYLGKNPVNWFKVFKFKGVLPGWESIVNHYSKNRFFFFLNDAGFSIIQNINYGPFVCPKWHLAIAKKT